MQTRREALVTIAGAAVLNGQTASFLSAGELTWLAALADTIIPRTDTPGASDAGVPAFIDRRMATNSQLAELFRAGMKGVDAEATSKFGKGFAAITPEQRFEVLKGRQDEPFFKTMKGLTVDGYYTSQAGLTQELGWHGNTFLTEFKGCTHPEHQK
jgi:gluconate 2-dehydrogenase gamma chain